MQRVLYVTKLPATAKSANAVQITQFTKAMDQIGLLARSYCGRYENRCLTITARTRASTILFYVLSFISSFITLKRRKLVLYTRDINFGIVAAFVLRRPVLIEFHNMGINPKLEKFLTSFIVPIFVSSTIKHDWISRFPALNGGCVLPAAAPDIHAIKQDSQVLPPMQENCKTILHTGSLYKHLTKDVARISHLIPDGYQLIHIGGGKREIDQLLERANTTKFTALTHLTHVEILKIQQHVDYFLLLINPAWEDFYYTSPLKLFEYLVWRKPIIATRSPALFDILGEDYPGYIDPQLDNVSDTEFADLIRNADSLKKWIDKVPVMNWRDRAQRVNDLINAL